MTSTSVSAPTSTPISSPLGIIGGSSFLASHYISSFTPLIVNTPYGDITIFTNQQKSIYFVQRHGASTVHEYSPPHLINHKAIIHGLHSLGIKRIIGFGSVGSLKRVLPVGTLLLPDDYFSPFAPITFYEYGKQGHIVPSLDLQLRQDISRMLSNNNIHHIRQGTYAQTTGPRFETPSEVRQLQQWADIVGMTCAHEATLTRELGISYTCICMIDNMANGVADTLLTTEDFHAGLKRNLQTIETVLGLVIETFAKQ
jgi:purine nucleoside phosphorylase